MSTFDGAHNGTDEYVRCMTVTAWFRAALDPPADRHNRRGARAACAAGRRRRCLRRHADRRRRSPATGLPVEYLDVYSPSMGRNIRGAVPGSPEPARHGPSKAVYLLDGLRAQDDYSGWDINTPAFEWFYNSGIAVVMPVGGQSSFYSDWYSPSNFNKQPYTYKWETFLTSELPQYLAANKQVSPTGNGVVGLSMSGGAALILSAYHPAQFVYAGVAVGLPEPVVAVHAAGHPGGHARRGRLQRRQHVGPAVGPGVEAQRPRRSRCQRIVANGTRLWIYCAPGGQTPLDQNADPNQALNATSLESLAIGSNKRFQEKYLAGRRHATRPSTSRRRATTPGRTGARSCRP